MILYVENTKDFSKNMRTNTLSKVVEEKSLYKNHMHFFFFHFSFFLILFYLTLQYCIGFAIYQNESYAFFTLTTNCYKRN